MIRSQRSSFDKLAIVFLIIFLLGLIADFEGYRLADSGKLVSLALSLGIIGYSAIILSKNPIVVFASSVIGPLTILYFVLLADFAPPAGTLGILALFGLVYPIFARIRPWPLAIIASVPPLLFGCLIAFFLLFAPALLPKGF